MHQADQRIPARHPSAISKSFGQEAVILSTEQTVVRMLNPSASDIWQLADGSRTVDQIAMALTTDYEVDFDQAQASVSQFVEEMVGRGLMIWSGPGSHGALHS